MPKFASKRREPVREYATGSEIVGDWRPTPVAQPREAIKHGPRMKTWQFSPGTRK